jgi:hypothetical protein
MHQLLQGNLTKPYKPTNRGFVENFDERSPTHGDRIMSCFDPLMIPVFSTLALEFAVCTRWFASVPGETWPNREFAHSATSRGLADIVWWKYMSNAKTVFEMLEAAGKTWRIYHDDYPHTWCYASLWDNPLKRNRFQPIRKLADAIKNDQLPTYTFIEPDYGVQAIGSGWGNSMHPGQAPSVDEFLGGERLIHNIYELLRTNPKVFEKTVFIITFDEHGGFYDHVHPPQTLNPGTAKWKGAFDFDLLGVRVPTLIISPWIHKHTVDDTQYDHTSIVQTLRTRYAMSQKPLTHRDEAAIPIALHKLLTDTLRKNHELPQTRPLTTAEGVALEQKLTGGPFPLAPPTVVGVTDEPREPDPFHAGLLALGEQVAAKLIAEGQMTTTLGIDGKPASPNPATVLQKFWASASAQPEDSAAQPAEPVTDDGSRAPTATPGGIHYAPRSLDDTPPRRPLKIYASDPMLGSSAGNKVVIEIENEVIGPGPSSRRIQVIDYDGGNRRYYKPVDLDDPKVLLQRGLEPSEADPRFHQQMVFAVAMKTLEHFDTALGRRLSFSPPLRIFPHAFHGSNAFYSPKDHAIMFGYFRADTKNPGPNLPGQTVYTCLSHDIIVHEMTHACVDRMRPLFMEPTNVDVLAFHEGFSDIVALFQHFTYVDTLRDEIQRTRTDLSKPTMLADLARQFGFASGSGKALRSALETRDALAYSRVFTPHQRGAILVGAVFDAFFAIYQKRIRDLIRISTGGTGTLPDGDLHPDLVSRVATEAAKTANSVLTMCIRAFEYLPPVDVTFGDYLRALVTADYEVYPEDPVRQRAQTIEAFRQRGIYPTNIRSLAEESLLWECPGDLRVPVAAVMTQLATTAMGYNREHRRYNMAEAARALDVWATQNAARLRLDPAREIQVKGFHTNFRVGPSGRLLVELVAQFVQMTKADESLGGVSMRGGTTLVINSEGWVRYMISKPLPHVDPSRTTSEAHEEGVRRFHMQSDFVTAWDERDPEFAYQSDEQRARRMKARMNFANLHGGRL